MFHSLDLTRVNILFLCVHTHTHTLFPSELWKYISGIVKMQSSINTILISRKVMMILSNLQSIFKFPNCHNDIFGKSIFFDPKLGIILCHYLFYLLNSFNLVVPCFTGDLGPWWGLRYHLSCWWLWCVQAYRWWHKSHFEFVWWLLFSKLDENILAH